jgi:hypothetical protein
MATRQEAEALGYTDGEKRVVRKAVLLTAFRFRMY